MGVRFKILSGLYLLILLLAHQNGMSPLGGIGDVFVGLGALLVMAVIALWPNATAGDKADLTKASWADRIEFDSNRD